MTSYPIFIFGWELDNKGLSAIAEQGLDTKEEARGKEISRATPLEYIENYLIEVQRKISSILGVIRLPGKEPIGVKTNPGIIKVYRHYDSSGDLSDFGYYFAIRIWEPARGELEGLPGDYLMSPLPWSKTREEDQDDDRDVDVMDKILSLPELDRLITYRSPYLSHDYYDMDRGYEELSQCDIEPDDIESDLESRD